jgi:hypothetical protein
MTSKADIPGQPLSLRCGLLRNNLGGVLTLGETMPRGKEFYYLPCKAYLKEDNQTT